MASGTVANVAPLLSLAARSLAAGRPAEAIAALQAAASQQPDNSGIHHDLGVACLESGRLDEAVAALTEAVARNPRFAKAYLRLGMAREAQGHAVAATDAYRRAAALLPSLTEAQFRAANLLEVLGEAQEALGFYRRAANGKTSLARIAGARAARIERRDADAERILRQTLALDPRNPMALDQLGNLLADAGRFEEAGTCFARAIAEAPLLAGSYYDLVRCRRIVPDDQPLIDAMRAAVADPRLDAGQRLRVHLALGKAADDLGDYAGAMRHFDAGDTIRAGLSPFDTAAVEALADRLIACVSPALIASRAAAGNHDATPVLILGMPRSGTTLLEQIVSSHPAAGGGGELQFWNDRCSEWDRAGSAADLSWLDQTAVDYVRTLRQIAPTASRVTDKMPLNFVWAGLVHLALPRATMIHCRRSPIDTALSIHQTYFNARLPFPTGGAALVGYYRAYRRITDHWRRVLPPERFVEVDYEALTATPDPVIERVIAACGLPWDAACLRPESNTRMVTTPSRWQARQPIYRSSVGRWRRYEPWLGPLRPLLDAEDETQV